MAATRTGSKQLLRDLNRNRVFNVIFSSGPISRADVARKSNLTAAAITQIVGDFVAAGLVSEQPAASVTMGRRPVLLQVNEEAGYVVGVYSRVHEKLLIIVVCNLNCQVVHALTVAHDFAMQGDLHQVVRVLADGIKACLTEASIPVERVLGVGLGLPGIMDYERGVCRNSPMLGWHDVEIAPALEYKLRLPVRLDNDVNALTLAKRHYGEGRDVANFLLIAIGNGIGLGIVIGGDIYRGSSGGAGEFGHWRVDFSADAAQCHCGRRGCLEALVATYALEHEAAALDPVRFGDGSLAALVEAAHAGDERVQAIFARAGNVLGTAVANLIDVFDPSLVLFSGESLAAGEYLLAPMREAIQAGAFGGLQASLLVNPEPTEDITWARGAASVVLDEIFRVPLYETDQPLPIDELLAAKTPARRTRVS
jgi:predicted NBD/HSP70 family sugar kinase